MIRRPDARSTRPATIGGPLGVESGRVADVMLIAPGAGVEAPAFLTAGTHNSATCASRLSLRRGEPYADVADGLWVHAERTRLRARYVAAATRAGELFLAAGEPEAARNAARHAITADSAAEGAHQLVVRTHLAEGDRAAALRALDECRAALLELGLEPNSTTMSLTA